LRRRRAGGQLLATVLEASRPRQRKLKLCLCEDPWQSTTLPSYILAGISFADILHAYIACHLQELIRKMYSHGEAFMLT